MLDHYAKIDEKFEDLFHAWLNCALTESLIPANVKAFSFNLGYPAGFDDVEFDIELIGANRFSLTDQDWACDEVWEPTQRRLNVPTSYSTDDYDVFLSKMKLLIEKFLSSDNPATRKLQNSEAIAIGFVDGPLDLVWINRLSSS